MKTWDAETTEANGEEYTEKELSFRMIGSLKHSRMEAEKGGTNGREEISFGYASDTGCN
jgi:hypothetical protein